MKLRFTNLYSAITLIVGLLVGCTPKDQDYQLQSTLRNATGIEAYAFKGTNIPKELIGRIIDQMSTIENSDFGNIALDGYLIGFYSGTQTNDIFLTQDFWEHDHVYYGYKNPREAKMLIIELEKLLFSNQGIDLTR